MSNRNDWVEDLQKNISELIARSPAADIERNMKAFMTQTFSRLDLVTREEFEVQVQLLEKALHRITALESRLDTLEGRRTDIGSTAAAQGAVPAGSSAGAAAGQAATTLPPSPPGSSV